MAEIDVFIAGRSYRVACRDGEEDSLLPADPGSTSDPGRILDDKRPLRLWYRDAYGGLHYAISSAPPRGRHAPVPTKPTWTPSARVLTGRGTGMPSFSTTFRRVSGRPSDIQWTAASSSGEITR